MILAHLFVKVPSSRRQQSDLFDLRVKLRPVTTRKGKITNFSDQQILQKCDFEDQIYLQDHFAFSTQETEERGGGLAGYNWNCTFKVCK